MRNFRIKGQVIKAEQWFYGSEIEGVRGDTEDLMGGNGLSPQQAMAFVITKKGMQKVYEGDLVVELPSGKKSVIDFEVLELLGGCALESSETPAQIAVIKENDKTFYTDNLTHPKAKGAEIIYMPYSEYKSIPATEESKEFFNA